MFQSCAIEVDSTLGLVLGVQNPIDGVVTVWEWILVTRNQLGNKFWYSKGRFTRKARLADKAVKSFPSDGILLSSSNKLHPIQVSSLLVVTS